MECEPGKRLANRGFSINHNQKWDGKERGGFKAARFLSGRSIAPFALEATPQTSPAHNSNGIFFLYLFQDQSVDCLPHIELDSPDVVLGRA